MLENKRDVPADGLGEPLDVIISVEYQVSQKSSFFYNINFARAIGLSVLWHGSILLHCSLFFAVPRNASVSISLLINQPIWIRVC